MINFTFYQFNNIRKDILRDCKASYICKHGNNKVIVSAPHGVSQVRLGKLKVAELGTIPVAYLISEATDSTVILKTQNVNDDANFDNISDYKNEIYKIIEERNCKYIFDIHGMSKSRKYDINLGINFGQNINSNIDLFNKIINMLEEQNFSISIDQPFSAGPQTISGSCAKKYNIFTIQIEINCDITNNPQNIKRCNKLVSTLIKIINDIPN